MKLVMKKVRESAVTPSYGSAYAAGADLYACLEEDVLVGCGKTVMIPTGIAMAIPEGYVGLIFARSGLSCKHGLAPANKVGVIDSDYRGEVMVALHNHNDLGEELSEADRSRFTIHHGDRIAQIVFVPYQTAEFELSDQLPDTDRGAGGFGSTGK